ncbi:hypothetical protein IG631_05753 [Alternaria alternata]|nr:hypothetical protein IG631_05753 [Alternaria alternata]
MTKGDWAVSTTFRSSKLLPRGLPLPTRNPRLPPASLISHCQVAMFRTLFTVEHCRGVYMDIQTRRASSMNTPRNRSGNRERKSRVLA